MHYVGKIDWSFADEPGPSVDFAAGLHRIRIAGPDQGAVHLDLYAGALDSGGWLAPHVHSYEEALYVLEGELLVRVDAQVHRLARGDFVLFPIGVRHGLGNAGHAQARWLSLNSPQKRDPATPWPDTFYEPAEPLATMTDAATRPPFGDPTLRCVGRDGGSPLEIGASTAADEHRRRMPAGTEDDLSVERGISVRMLVDKPFGADMVTISSVDCEEGGAAMTHDHPFEEAYVLLAGEIVCELEGERYTLHAGDVAVAGVGSVHGLRNEGTAPVRWIEMRAPQPPARHAYRSAARWERYDQRRTRR